MFAIFGAGGAAESGRCFLVVDIDAERICGLVVGWDYCTFCIFCDQKCLPFAMLVSSWYHRFVVHFSLSQFDYVYSLFPKVVQRVLAVVAAVFTTTNIKGIIDFFKPFTASFVELGSYLFHFYEDITLLARCVQFLIVLVGSKQIFFGYFVC